jgi:hypothetical protein
MCYCNSKAGSRLRSRVQRLEKLEKEPDMKRSIALLAVTAAALSMGGYLVGCEHDREVRERDDRGAAVSEERTVHSSTTVVRERPKPPPTVIESEESHKKTTVQE